MEGNCGFKILTQFQNYLASLNPCFLIGEMLHFFPQNPFQILEDIHLFNIY